MPAQLSGGQQQRVAIARASAPAMILLTMTSALDPELVGDVLAVMRQLADEGMTMLVVTLRCSSPARSPMLFMDGGVVVEQGSPNQVIGNPQQQRTRTFLARVLNPIDADG